jgi:hypothetical protein
MYISSHWCCKIVPAPVHFQKTRVITSQLVLSHEYTCGLDNFYWVFNLTLIIIGVKLGITGINLNKNFSKDF